MSNSIIVPFNMDSQGAIRLSSSMMIPRVPREEAWSWGGRGKTVINWGCSDLPPFASETKVLNPDSAVAWSMNKRRFLTTGGFRVPPVTTSLTMAEEWLSCGKTVVARTRVCSSQGIGIVIVKPGEEGTLPDCDLYTQFIPNTTEYRVHIISGQVVNVQRKGHTENFEGERGYYVRNAKTGWTLFSLNDFYHDHDVIKQALAAAYAMRTRCGLDFGAYDVLYNGENAYVLEVNTAPGMGEVNCKRYSQRFNEIIEDGQTRRTFGTTEIG